MYSSFHVGVIRQHAIWLIEAGITCIEIDWSNSLWGHQRWAARGAGAQQLNNATALALHTYAQMRLDGDAFLICDRLVNLKPLQGRRS